MWVGRHEGGVKVRGFTWCTEIRGAAACAFGTTVLQKACAATLAEGLARWELRSPTEQQMSLAGVHSPLSIKQPASLYSLVQGQYYTLKALPEKSQEDNSLVRDPPLLQPLSFPSQVRCSHEPRGPHPLSLKLTIFLTWMVTNWQLLIANHAFRSPSQLRDALSLPSTVFWV